MSFVPRSVHADGGASEFINALKRNRMAPKGKKGKKSKKSTQARVTRVHHRNVDDGPQISYEAISTPVYKQPRSVAEARALWSEAVSKVRHARGPKRAKFNAEAEYYGDRYAFLYDHEAYPYPEDEGDYPQYTKAGRERAAWDAERANAYAVRSADIAEQKRISELPYDGKDDDDI